MKFFKYQGTGNDFIMIDGMTDLVNFTASEIALMCDRRFGIGADGLIILKTRLDCDFEMDYYNADGTQSFCGNGSRCAQAFAKYLGLITNESYFYAIDGFHHGRIEGNNYATRMGNVAEIGEIEDDYFINTGSPHHIKYVENIDEVDVYKQGNSIRNSPKYKTNGVNVNFVSIQDDYLKVRTYERGVEAETYSCGTGVTAVAISYLYKSDTNINKIKIETKGGSLRVDLERISANEFTDIWLIGPAELVYKGEI